jgi:phosphoribosyl-ATP pyrophosphohydrolase/phosphoribosyl-AMP cyclohydrolase
MMDMAKKINGSIFLLDKKAVKGPKDKTVISEDPVLYATQISDSGADEIIVFDLSDGDKAHEEALDMIKDICKAVDVPVTGAGNVKRMEDIKKLLYAGCKKACLNFRKAGNIEILKEVSEKFGRDKIVICYEDQNAILDNLKEVKEYASELILFPENNESVKSTAELPLTVVTGENCTFNSIYEFFASYDLATGVCGSLVTSNLSGINDSRNECLSKGLKMYILEPKFTWEQLKKNSDGMVPVIVQDYRTDQVLMLAYMNEEAYNMTLQTGRMTYFSRSRNELWIKGETSSHYQFVKELTADCDLDTILAKVKQVGAACHTGSYSCFFNEIAKKDYSEKNPQKVLDSVYEVIKDRKEHPREGSYTNYLYEKGIDKILKKVGEEATEMVIAAKNPNDNEVIYEMSDFLYHMMVLMAVKNVSWEDITDELSRR